MKLYIKYLCASFLILISGMAHAQDRPCITVEGTYAIPVSGSSEISGRAVLTFQDNAYHLSSNGVESYCDGTSVWLLDNAAKEVYIETLAPEAEAYMREVAEKAEYLQPDSEASFFMPDGNTVNILVKSIKKSDRKDISSFRPTFEFDSSWVVTDLR